MSNRAELNRLNEDLGRTWTKILDLINSDDNGKIMVYYDNDKMAENASAICELFDVRIGNVRSKLRKIADRLPKGRKKKNDG